MNFRALGIGLFIFLYYASLSAGTDPPPPPAPPGEEFPIPGILLIIAGAVFFGVYKKIKQPKK
jgi:hypothetical protein